MKTSALFLLPATSPGSDIVGTPQKAAAYYLKTSSLQTVSWLLTNFVGAITIEATLDSRSDSNNYFTILTIDTGAVNSTANIEGRYTWIRATVTGFTSGSIEQVTLGY